MSGLEFRPAFTLLDPDTKTWIDARAGWILDEFGWDFVRARAVIVPTANFFPHAHTASEEGARKLLDRVCAFMQFHPASVQLQLYSERTLDGHPRSLGAYDTQENDGAFCIRIDVSQLDQPLQMAATMARELGHVHLLGHRRLGEETDDHEPLTDLMTVFLGMGVITANAAFQVHSWHLGQWSEGNVSRRGYLTMPMYGYALALLSKVRFEDKPQWAKFLRPDVRHALKKSLRYFQRYGAPDLRSVRTTTARPAIGMVRVEESAEPADVEMPIGPDTCHYCGATLGNHAPEHGICAKCQRSILDNELDLESERREAALVQRKWNKVLLWLLLLSAGLAIAVGLLGRFGYL